MLKINRRIFLGSTAGLGAGAFLPHIAIAQSTRDLDIFMALSQTLTKRQNLDRTLGQRYLDALKANTPDVVQDLTGMASAAQSGTLSAAQQANALKIMRAWYTGQVGKTTVAFENALMYGAMGTTVYIRSYCPAEPAYWAQKPVISG